MYTCIVCLEDSEQRLSSPQEDNDLIQPCSCRTSFAHRKCLDQIRSYNEGKLAFRTCMTCKTSYQYTDIPVINNKYQRFLKFFMYTTVDFMTMFLFSHSILAIISFCISLTENSFDTSATSDHSLTQIGIVYYIESWIIFFVMTGMYFTGKFTSTGTNNKIVLMGYLVIGIVFSVWTAYVFVMNRIKFRLRQLYNLDETKYYRIKDLYSTSVQVRYS